MVLYEGAALHVRGFPGAGSAGGLADARDACLRLTLRERKNNDPFHNTRFLPIERDSSGNRFRSWLSCSEACRESDLGRKFGLEGPDLYVLCFRDRQVGYGSGCSTRRVEKPENHLQDDDRLNVAHETLTEIFECLGCIDQCDS